MITADRLLMVEEYYFSKKLREVNALKAAGAPIINLGIGSPDLAPPNAVITAIKDKNHNFTAQVFLSNSPMAPKAPAKTAIAKAAVIQAGMLAAISSCSSEYMV